MLLAYYGTSFEQLREHAYSWKCLPPCWDACVCVSVCTTLLYVLFLDNISSVKQLIYMPYVDFLSFLCSLLSSLSSRNTNIVTEMFLHVFLDWTYLSPPLCCRHRTTVIVLPRIYLSSRSCRPLSGHHYRHVCAHGTVLTHSGSDWLAEGMKYPLF